MTFANCFCGRCRRAAVRSDFPFFRANPDIVYLDSAATSQKPQCVIDSMVDFMTKRNSNVGRSLYPISSEASALVAEAREKAARFINAKPEEIIFTEGTTQALNMVAASVCGTDAKGNIVITRMEHSSNHAPWLEACRRNGIELRLADVDADGILRAEAVTELIDDETIAVSVTGMSNVTGQVTDIGAICSHARRMGALSVVDAAQLVVHNTVDVRTIGCDFLAFSGHKIYGPMGTGVLFASGDSIGRLKPFTVGGGSVERDYSPKTGIHGFEAGTRNIAAIVALGQTFDYLKSNRNAIKNIEDELLGYLFEKLSVIDGIRMITKSPSQICSFTTDLLGCYDIGAMLGKFGICIRTGSCCAYSLMDALGVQGVCRASVGPYNTKEEIDIFTERLSWVLRRCGGFR